MLIDIQTDCKRYEVIWMDHPRPQEYGEGYPVILQVAN